MTTEINLTDETRDAYEALEAAREQAGAREEILEELVALATGNRQGGLQVTYAAGLVLLDDGQDRWAIDEAGYRSAVGIVAGQIAKGHHDDEEERELYQALCDACTPDWCESWASESGLEGWCRTLTTEQRDEVLAWLGVDAPAEHDGTHRYGVDAAMIAGDSGEAVDVEAFVEALGDLVPQWVEVYAEADADNTKLPEWGETKASVAAAWDEARARYYAEREAASA